MKFLIITLFVAYVSADVAHLIPSEAGAPSATIEKLSVDIGLFGPYKFAYQTSNGIAAEEEGALKNVPGSDVPAEVVQGQASWTAPDGQVVSFQYTADENGYQAQGPFIPTPPPIPEAIIRSLEYIRANPPKENQ